jgi:hypothetical protein
LPRHIQSTTEFCGARLEQGGIIIIIIIIIIINNSCREPVAHICNPSYSGGRDQENHSWRLARANTSRDCLYNTQHKKGLAASATSLTTGVGEDAGKKEPSYTAGGNVD